MNERVKHSTQKYLFLQKPASLIEWHLVRTTEVKRADMMLEIKVHSTLGRGRSLNQNKDIYYQSITSLIKNIPEKFQNVNFNNFIKENSLVSTNHSFSQILSFFFFVSSVNAKLIKKGKFWW